MSDSLEAQGAAHAVIIGVLVAEMANKSADPAAAMKAMQDAVDSAIANMTFYGMQKGSPEDVAFRNNAQIAASNIFGNYRRTATPLG